MGELEIRSVEGIQLLDAPTYESQESLALDACNRVRLLTHHPENLVRMIATSASRKRPSSAAFRAGHDPMTVTVHRHAARRSSGGESAAVLIHRGGEGCPTVHRGAARSGDG